MALSDLAFIDDTGYHLADYPAFLAYYQDQYRAIYGADVDLNSDTQDGQWVAVEAKAAYDSAALGQSVYNSFSPSSAKGVGLSRVVKINGLKRHVPSFSTVTLTVVGSSGTVINNGVAQDTINQKWLLPTVVTIPGGGTINVTATAELVGFVTADVATVTKIFTNTLGWQTVNNAAAAIPGAPVETDAQLRARQTVSTADPSLTVLDGTVGGVSNLTGVTKVRAYENDTDITDANTLPPHSISLVVAGGDDVAVAQEILLHKTPGTNTYGTTSELVYDAHGMPVNISFYRPTVATISVQLTIASGVGWSNDFVPLIEAAMAAVINAGKIGDTVLITKLFAPAYLNGAPPGLTYSIVSLQIEKNGGGFGTINIPLSFNEEAVCDPDTDITVIVT